MSTVNFPSTYISINSQRDNTRHISEMGHEVESYLRTDSMPVTLVRNSSIRSTGSRNCIGMTESSPRYSDHSK